MKLFRAQYNTETMKGVIYDFYAANIKAAKSFRKRKFSAKYVRVFEIDQNTFQPV